MILTIKNQVAGTRSYLGGLVTVSESSQTTVSREFNVLLVSDAQFLSDLGSNGTVSIILNNGVKDLNVGEALTLAQVLGNFSTDPIATIPLYYTAAININQTAGTAASSTVWAMRNDQASVRQVVIERIYLIGLFNNATPLGANTLVYDLRRFSGATPTGGVSVTPIKMSNAALTTAVTDARVLNTGLTVSGVNFENPFMHISIPDTRGSSTEYLRNNMAMKLAPGEGLAIRLTNAAVNGQSLSGEIVWSER